MTSKKWKLLLSSVSLPLHSHLRSTGNLHLFLAYLSCDSGGNKQTHTYSSPHKLFFFNLNGTMLYIFFSTSLFHLMIQLINPYTSVHTDSVILFYSCTILHNMTVPWWIQPVSYGQELWLCFQGFTIIKIPQSIMFFMWHSASGRLFQNKLV